MEGASERLEAEADADMVELATRLFTMARGGATATLAAYVDAGIPVDLANHHGDTLLMLAAYHGHAETVRVLLERGADPEKVNDRGQRPLAGAVFKAELGVIRVLIDHGADPDAGHPTALATAEMFGRADIVELLGSTA